MCRFLAYIGTPIRMDALLFKPANSLIKQSISAHETEEPLNGDGFGIGWYMPELDRYPGLFVSVRPAWNDKNLQYIAPKIKSDCIFAHVRAASHGDVSEDNCHPFHYKQFLFMHNGDIDGFKHIKRAVRDTLSDELYNMIQGDTDSEHIFAMFLNKIDLSKRNHTAEEMALAMEQVFRELRDIKRQLHVRGYDYVNAAITDGDTILAVRYISDPRVEPPTLYYSEGGRYACEDGVCKMVPEEKEKAILVVSERLTDIESDWHKIPVNQFVIIDKGLNPVLRAVNLPREESDTHQ